MAQVFAMIAPMLAKAGTAIVSGAKAAGSFALANPIQTIGIAGSAIGTIGSANADRNAAEDMAQRKEREAGDLNQMAAEKRALAGRRASEERRRSRLVVSSIRAKAGTGATDDSVLQLMEDATAQGEVNAGAAAYEGETQKRQLTQQAKDALWQANQSRQSGGMNARNTIISGISNMGMRFGGQLMKQNPTQPKLHFGSQGGIPNNVGFGGR
jgi:hypothetical protein